MDVLNFDDIFKKPFFSFWLIGIPLKDQINGKLSWKFNILFVTIVLLLVEEFSFFLTRVSSPERNFLELTALTPCFGVGGLSVVKILSIALSRHKIYQLHDSLKELYHEITIDERKRNLVINKVKMMHKYTNYYIILNVILESLYNFLSLIYNLYDYIVKGETNYYVQYPVLVPFSIDTFWSWLLVYTHNFTGGWLCAIYFITVDILYFNLSALVCYNFTVLGDEIERLQPHDVGSLGAIVRKHQYILNLSKDLDDIFTLPNLYNVLVGSIQICALGFNLVMGDIKQIPAIATFLFSQIMLFFFMSVFGENLIRESTEVGNKAYLCEWYNMDKKAKKILLFLMTRANKPQVLTAYKFSIISYQSFTKIISTSWTYFTLLRTVYDSSENDQN